MSKTMALSSAIGAMRTMRSHRSLARVRGCGLRRSSPVSSSASVATDIDRFSPSSGITAEA